MKGRLLAAETHSPDITFTMDVSVGVTGASHGCLEGDDGVELGKRGGGAGDVV